MGYKYQKKDILKIGYDVLRRNNYHHTGINEILKKANIPKGSFYNFFKSKEDFVLQIIDSYGEINRNEINKYLNDKSKSPYHRLELYSKALITKNETEKI